MRQLIDFSQPVAVLLLAVLHFVADADRPYQAVRTIVDPQVAPRSSEDIARFFDGLELVGPGLVNVTLWRPDRPSGARRSLMYGGVSRKP